MMSETGRGRVDLGEEHEGGDGGLESIPRSSRFACSRDPASFLRIRNSRRPCLGRRSEANLPSTGVTHTEFRRADLERKRLENKGKSSDERLERWETCSSAEEEAGLGQLCAGGGE